MNLTAYSIRTLESVDRRMLGAFQLLDAVTHLPVHRSVEARVLSALLARSTGDIVVPLSRQDVQLRQNRSGFQVVARAPFFDDYAGALLDPQPPSETQDGPLRLRLAIEDAGPHYLPRQFTIELPRAHDPNASETVFEAVPVLLFRTPSAPVQDGWALLRVRVTETGSNPPNPVPGVLIRVFRSPRAAAVPPIGLGMTEWRGDVRGEALVPITGVQRFRPGAGDNVMESDLPAVWEAARAVAFTGAANQSPDPTRILTAIPQDPAAPAPAEVAVIRATAPLFVRAGHTHPLQLSMP